MVSILPSSDKFYRKLPNFLSYLFHAFRGLNLQESLAVLSRLKLRGL